MNSISELLSLAVAVAFFANALVEFTTMVVLGSIEQCKEKMSFYMVIFSFFKIILLSFVGIYFITYIVDRLKKYRCCIEYIVWIFAILVFVGAISISIFWKR